MSDRIVLERIDHGWRNAAGRSDDGIYVAAVLYDGWDREHLTPQKPEKFRLRDDVPVEQWRGAGAELLPCRLELAFPGGRRTLADAPVTEFASPFLLESPY